MSFTWMLFGSNIRFVSRTSVSSNVPFSGLRVAALLFTVMLYSTTFDKPSTCFPFLSSSLLDISTWPEYSFPPTLTLFSNVILSDPTVVPLPDPSGIFVIFVWYSSSTYMYGSEERFRLLILIDSFLLSLSNWAITSLYSVVLSFTHCEASIRHFKDPSMYSIPAGIVSTMLSRTPFLIFERLYPSRSLMQIFHVATPPESSPDLLTEAFSCLNSTQLSSSSENSASSII